MPAVDPTLGLTPEGVLASRLRHGENRVTRPPGRTVFDILKHALAERTLIVLMAAAVLALGVEVLRGYLVAGYTPHLIDGFAILLAVAIASFVTTINEARAEKKFRSLEDLERDHPVRVIRGGIPSSIPSSELVVGDVVVLDLGDRVPADGELTDEPQRACVDAAGLSVDQSTLTGESEPVRKGQGDLALLGSTVVTEGSGRMVVTAVGAKTEMGRQMERLLGATPTRTPLEDRLAALANRMGAFGAISALLTFLALLGSSIARDQLELSLDLSTGSKVLELAIVAITVLVVAVPEGLPLAVTISLSYSVVRMAKDRALVKRLSACETMGAATVVCTDKTGTLTENQMSITQVWVPHLGGFDARDAQALPAEVRARIAEIARLDSTVLVSKAGRDVRALGNPTEAALLVFLEKLEVDATDAEVVGRFGFTSERKRMSTLASIGGQLQLLLKGAPEVVMDRCVGAELAEATRIAEAMAARGERTLALARRVVSEDLRNAGAEELERDLELVAVVAIRDPLRSEVHKAIADCKRAGVEVKVLTGDHRAIAESIARDLSLVEDGDEILEGSDLRELDDVAFDQRLPRLRVVARSTPTDKLRLVQRLVARGEVVAVTGDGTNDAAALDAADVGFAMGIRGTAVARDAADVILLDDDFSTLVKAIAWGRTIFENVQKFLLFQLTVNVVAVGTAFLAAVLGFGVPLNTVQLLWVNLIMDTLAALALATEPPTQKALDRPPHGRVEPLLSRPMIVQIAATGTFMISVLVVAMETSLFIPPEATHAEKLTFVFNAFVLMQLANELNARSPRLDRSVLDGLGRSWVFGVVIFATLVLQVMIVEFGGVVFRTTPLSWSLWLRSFGLGASVLAFGFCLRWAGRAAAKRAVP
ncbi:MAG: calcium-translocating P-type ATPase, PMCA-type [Deltaproteobacteria bacterium]|nr:calcium-translocating P-type ATPase, PMCA-type [Deltaproteobacteria bacterium]